jgi:hypothetical protein
MRAAGPRRHANKAYLHRSCLGPGGLLLAGVRRTDLAQPRRSLQCLLCQPTVSLGCHYLTGCRGKQKGAWRNSAPRSGKSRNITAAQTFILPSAVARCDASIAAVPPSHT